MARTTTAQGGPVTVRVSQEAEDAVRRYLEIVADGGGAKKPAKQPTVDADAIRAQYDDPLDALKAISTAMKEAAATEDPEVAFVRYAKTWAEHNGVSREAFRAMGVKPSVLQRIYDGAPTRAPKVAAAPARSRVDSGALGKAILAMPAGTRITASMVVEELGGTAQTARKILDQLAKGGELVALGRDPDHASKGPAPKVWERV